jgi:hypothetical protein
MTAKSVRNAGEIVGMAALAVVAVKLVDMGIHAYNEDRRAQRKARDARIVRRMMQAQREANTDVF